MDQLKLAKANYKVIKQNQRALRDEYATGSKSKQLVQNLRKEQKKVQKKKFRSVFEKKRIKSISIVEYLVNRNLIRISEKI